jgi:ATP-dependent Clp protease ATP-binding subunit ClpA
MFERFDQRARQAVVWAQESARELGHAYIGTEHQLYGLAREQEGIAARVLFALGLTEARIRDDVIRIVGHAQALPLGHIPFTPRARTVLERADRERLTLGDLEVGTEHMLLGLLGGDGEGVGLRVLREAGFEPEAIRNEVIRSRDQQPLHHAIERDRPVLPVEWLAAVSTVIAPLGAEIRRTLGRDPDTGDLLVALACLPGLPVREAFDQLGIQPVTVADAVQQTRQSQPLTSVGETDATDEIRQLLRLLKRSTK